MTATEGAPQNTPVDSEPEVQPSAEKSLADRIGKAYYEYTELCRDDVSLSPEAAIADVIKKSGFNESEAKKFRDFIERAGEIPAPRIVYADEESSTPQTPSQEASRSVGTRTRKNFLGFLESVRSQLSDHDYKDFKRALERTNDPEEFALIPGKIREAAARHASGTSSAAEDQKTLETPSKALTPSEQEELNNLHTVPTNDMTTAQLERFEELARKILPATKLPAPPVAVRETEPVKAEPPKAETSEQLKPVKRGRPKQSGAPRISLPEEHPLGRRVMSNPDGTATVVDVDEEGKIVTTQVRYKDEEQKVEEKKEGPPATRADVKPPQETSPAIPQGAETPPTLIRPVAIISATPNQKDSEGSSGTIIPSEEEGAGGYDIIVRLSDGSTAAVSTPSGAIDMRKLNVARVSPDSEEAEMVYDQLRPFLKNAILESYGTKARGPGAAPMTAEDAFRPETPNLKRVLKELEESAEKVKSETRELGLEEVHKKAISGWRRFPRTVAISITVALLAGTLATGQLPAAAGLLGIVAQSIAGTTAGIAMNEWLRKKNVKHSWVYAALVGAATGMLTGASINLFEHIFSSPSISLENSSIAHAPPPTSMEHSSIAAHGSTPTPQGGEAPIQPPVPHQVHAPHVGPVHVVHPGDPVALHGIDSLLSSDVFNLPHGPLTHLSEASRVQFIDALRHTLAQNSQFAHQFIASPTGAEAVFQNGDLIVHAGDKISLDVFHNPDFLEALRQNIVTHEKTYLLDELGGERNVAELLRAVSRFISRT